MRANEIRKRFTEFFAGRGHEVVRSSSLIPHNDPTLYFVNAGMVQFKEVFTGHEERDYTRATTVQKCLRVSGKHNDLEAVGRTPRHHTFFEMLGNFSFGDYFKEEAIDFAWTFLTEVLGLPEDKMWVTVFEDDDEAYELWRSRGFPEARLQRLGADENFWSMGPVGPCGPCSEIYFDLGEEMDDDLRGPAGGSDRYFEIWNLVFMEYEQHEDGTRTELPNKSIDTGAGLERLTAVCQGALSNYDTQLFQTLIGLASKEAGVAYGADPQSDIALRVIADHARATAFLIADGIMPSNTERGYVLRRIMRRAIRYGSKLGIDHAFFHRVTDGVIAQFSDAYSQLEERSTFIDEVVRAEEKRFRLTLERGTRRLEGVIEELPEGGEVSGDDAFYLSDTCGFPLDLTELIAREHGLTVDTERFDELLEEQRQKGRESWKGSGEEAVSGLWQELAKKLGETEFTGYEGEEDVAEVIALVHTDGDEARLVDALEAEQRGVVLLDKTPFYGESGGQVGDTGSIGEFTVSDTQKASGLILHQGMAEASISVGDSVKASADGRRRQHTRRNHTATHLLHAALRQVLGDHVTQKGSLVGPFRLRFDFSHHKPVTPDELAEIEALVNREIMKNTPLSTELKSLDQAIEDGAMALFGEKYDDDVRVVSIPGFSVELCGGTHVRATGDIGMFKLTSEGGVAAGVRRIEAQTGVGALRWVDEMKERVETVAASLKAGPDQIVEAVERLQKERKAVEKELAALKRDLAKQAAGDIVSDAREIDGIKVVAAEFDGNLKEQADRLRDKLGSALVVLAARRGDSKVQLVVAATKDVAKRVSAGNVIKEIAPLVGGRGGGRPDMAQGGGSDPSGIPAALERAWSYVESALS